MSAVLVRGSLVTALAGSCLVLGPGSADGAAEDRSEPVAQRPVEGSMFVDFDRDGRIDPGEQYSGMPTSLQVTVTDADGNVASTRTGEGGAFSVDGSSALTTAAVRVEFETPAGFSPTFAQTFGDSVSDSHSPIRYLDQVGQRDGLLYGIVPNSRCPDAVEGVGGATGNSPDGNPNSARGKVWTTCFVDGARVDPRGAQDVLVGGNFDAVGWDPSDAATGFGHHLDVEHLGSRADLGALWGLAHDEWDGRLYTSAVVKRHAALGPEGIDGLYWIDVGETSVDIAVRSIGLDELSPPDAPTFGDDPTNCPTNGDGAYDYDSFVRLATAVGGSWDCRDLDAAPTVDSADAVLNHDWWGYDRTGRAGIGDIDTTPDGEQLLVMNATADALFVYDLSGEGPEYRAHHELANPGCADDRFEAWAIEPIDAAFAYVGITCTAEVSGSPGDLRAEVVRVELESGDQETVATIPFDYRHGPGYTEQQGPLGGRFQPWHGVGPNGFPTLPPLQASSSIEFLSFSEAYGYQNGWDFHQPLLTDIEVDPFDGSLVVAITDRWAMMMGSFNCDLDPTSGGCGYDFPTPPPGDYDGIAGDDPVDRYTSTLVAYVAGDLLRLCNTSGDPDQPVLVLEGGDGCDPTEHSPTFEPGFGGGPAGSTEWYWNDQAFEDGGTDNSHPEGAQGAVYVADRSNDVVYTAMNPVETFGAGLTRDSNRDGSHQNGLQFFRTDFRASDGTGWKSAGVGDVEGCSIPIEIGNLVWFDAVANGTRDAGEMPLAGVTVTLTDATSGIDVATTTSDADGVYYFGSHDGLLPFNDYAITFDISTIVNLADLPVAAIDELFETVSISQGAADASGRGRIDSNLRDGSIEVTTGAPGENDHTLDAGFTSSSGSLVDGVAEDRTLWVLLLVTAALIAICVLFAVTFLRRRPNLR